MCVRVYVGRAIIDLMYQSHNIRGPEIGKYPLFLCFDVVRDRFMIRWAPPGEI